MSGRVIWPHLVWCPKYCETRDDAWRCYAYSPEDAAAKWGRWRDALDDYPIVGGEPATVIVEDPLGKRARWRVYGETQPVYRAVKEDEE